MKLVCGKHDVVSPPRMKDAEEIAHLGAISPFNIVRLARLLLFIRVVQEAPFFVLHVLGSVIGS